MSTQEVPNEWQALGFIIEKRIEEELKILALSSYDSRAMHSYISDVVGVTFAEYRLTKQLASSKLSAEEW